MKTCKTCKIPKAANDFSPVKASRDGLQAQCKACLAVKARERYAEDPEPIKAKNRVLSKEYYENNKDVAKRKILERYHAKSEEIKPKQREYWHNNKETLLEYAREYRAKNAEALKIKAHERYLKNKAAKKHSI